MVVLDVGPEELDEAGDEAPERGVVHAWSALIEVADEHVADRTATKTVGVHQFRCRSLTLPTHDRLQRLRRGEHADGPAQVPGLRCAVRYGPVPAQVVAAQFEEVAFGDRVEASAGVENDPDQRLLPVVDVLARHPQLAADPVESSEQGRVERPLSAVIETGRPVAVEKLVARPKRPGEHHKPQAGEEFIATRRRRSPVLGDEFIDPLGGVSVRGIPAPLPPVAVEPL